MVQRIGEASSFPMGTIVDRFSGLTSDDDITALSVCFNINKMP